MLKREYKRGQNRFSIALWCQRSFHLDSMLIEYRSTEPPVYRSLALSSNGHMESTEASMTTRSTHPAGTPCWIDLWTSDVDASRRFYDGLFGWTADDPSSEFHGYFGFRRKGEWIAGCMGDIGTPDGDMFHPAENVWKIYLSVDDINAAADAAKQAGATRLTDIVNVGDLGRHVVLADPTGANFALWQAATHPGFTTIDEPGAPTWFELHTRDHSTAVSFYRDVFGIDVELVSDTDEFRYATLNGPAECGQVAGIMDAHSYLPPGMNPFWAVYFFTDDVDESVAKVVKLGGSVIHGAEDTPYGRIATVADSTGAAFCLRTPPQGEPRG